MKKKKLSKTIGWAIIIFILILILGTHLLLHLLNYSDARTATFFEKNHTLHEIDYLDHEFGTIRVIRSGDKNKKSCFIGCHGAPGSWDAFKDYMVNSEILEKADFISYDRPGYGSSQPGKDMASIAQQANLLSIIRSNYNYENYILVGHSYGGPIIVKNAIDNPEGLGSIVLIAPAIAPDAEKYWWFSPFGYWKSTRWLLPGPLQVSGIEKYTHEVELRILEPEIHNLSVPTVLIHSMDDALAPAEGNIEFMKKVVPDSLLTNYIYKDKGHLVIWNDVKEVTKILLSSMND